MDQATKNVKNQTENTEVTKPTEPDKGMPAWLSPLLSAIGSMGGSYMIWIKPLQTSMELLTGQVKTLQDEIRELKKQNRELKGIKSEPEETYETESYLPVKRSDRPSFFSKRRI
jgi:hypothetical protein